MRARWTLGLPIALLLLGAGPHSPDPPGTEVMAPFTHGRFDPETVRVARGGRVTFHNLNAGDHTHTVVADDRSFESPPLGPNGEWTHRFPEKGEHGYHLREHPETRGRALVR